MVTFVRSLCFAVLALLVGCGGKAPEDLFPPGQPSVQDFDSGVENPPCPTPGPVTVADVVPDLYHLTDTCCDPVQDLGLDAHGATPTYAWSPEKGRLYKVAGRYDGAIYVKVGDQCLPGGPYEGYDLFTLEPLR